MCLPSSRPNSYLDRCFIIYFEICREMRPNNIKELCQSLKYKFLWIDFLPPQCQEETVIDLKVLQKFLYFIENGPKHYKRIFDVTVLQHEEDMRSHLGQGEGYCKQIHTAWVWFDLTLWELSILQCYITNKIWGNLMSLNPH